MTVALAIRQHAADYLKLPTTPIVVKKAMCAILPCRTGQLGSVLWQCDGCQRQHWVGRSCGNRHCPTCGAEKIHAWRLRHQQQRLLGVTYYMVTFTMPRQLAVVLRDHQRAGYTCLMQASAKALCAVARMTRSLKDGELGLTSVLHTWGRDPLVYHPHVHMIVPGGVVVRDRCRRPIAWKNAPANFLVNHRVLLKVYKAKLADALRHEGLYDRIDAVAWTKKFVVDIKPVGDGNAAVDYLAPYVHRMAISDHRVRSVTDTSVTYLHKPTGSDTVKTRTVDGLAFVKGLAQHVLPRGFRKVRNYGHLSSNSSIEREHLKMLVWQSLGWVYWLASAHGAQPTEIPPLPKLRCGKCGGCMKVKAICKLPLDARLGDAGGWLVSLSGQRINLWRDDHTPPRNSTPSSRPRKPVCAYVRKTTRDTTLKDKGSCQG